MYFDNHKPSTGQVYVKNTCNRCVDLYLELADLKVEINLPYVQAVFKQQLSSLRSSLGRID